MIKDITVIKSSPAKAKIIHIDEIKIHKIAYSKWRAIMLELVHK